MLLLLLLLLLLFNVQVTGPLPERKIMMSDAEFYPSPTRSHTNDCTA